MGGDVTVERVQGNTCKVTAEIRNTRAIRTRLEATELYNTGQPGRGTLTGSGLTAQASGCRSGDLGHEIDLQLDGDPSDVVLESRVPGRSWVTVT